MNNWAKAGQKLNSFGGVLLTGFGIFEVLAGIATVLFGDMEGGWFIAMGIGHILIGYSVLEFVNYVKEQELDNAE